MRTLLFTGPGGAGTTTLASAAAVRAARSGRRTVLLSRQVPDVAGLADVPGLRVVRAEPQAALERWWGRHVPSAAAALPLLTVPPASSVVALPGMAELALLAELAQADADADVVVVDAGPVDSAVALVTGPAALRWWLAQLLPGRLRVLGALRVTALQPEGEARAAADRALAAIPALEQSLARLALTDPAATAVVAVVPPRRSAVPVLRTLATALAVHGQRPAAVVTRTLPDAAGDWFAARLQEQQEVLAELASHGPVVPVAETPTAPADVDAVAGLELELPEPAHEAAEIGPEQVEGGWRLVVSLPFAERSATELTRWGDDLVLTAAGSRRSIRLDSLLRRCTVTGAALADAGTADARLHVSFVPDPQQWPADLLDSHERASRARDAVGPPAAEEG